MQIEISRQILGPKMENWGSRIAQLWGQRKPETKGLYELFSWKSGRLTGSVERN